VNDLDTIACHLVCDGLDELCGELALTSSPIIMGTLMFLREAMQATETLITLGAGEVTEGELLAAAVATGGGCHLFEL